MADHLDLMDFLLTAFIIFISFFGTNVWYNNDSKGKNDEKISLTTSVLQTQLGTFISVVLLYVVKYFLLKKSEA